MNLELKRPYPYIVIVLTLNSTSINSVAIKIGYYIERDYPIDTTFGTC